MKRKTIAILGGAAAGIRAASIARTLAPEARIIMIERNREPAIQPSGIAAILSGEIRRADLADTRLKTLAEERGLELFAQTECLSIDPASSSMRLSADQRESELKFDTLVFALGAKSVFPPSVPARASNLVAFRTLEDLDRIEAVLNSGAKRVVILGGGPFGIEAADAFIRRGIRPTIIEKGSRILPQFSSEIAEEVSKAISPSATILTSCEALSATEGGGKISELILSNGERLGCDLLISAIGLVPRTELLVAAGARITAENRALLVDQYCMTSLKNIYACGVCLAAPMVFSSEPVWLAQAAIAERSAEIAGANAAGGSFKLPQMTGSMILRANGLVFGRTGMSAADLSREIDQKQGQVASIAATTLDPSYPGSTPLKLLLYWRLKDQRILGLEICGKAGVDKRLDAGAAAIRHGATLDSLSFLDFPFAPQFNGSSDPLNVAALVGLTRITQ